ncbi:hypothetical protein Tco_0318925 [Tanacetum coccineum]
MLSPQSQNPWRSIYNHFNEKLSQEDPLEESLKALEDESCVKLMQEELLQFKLRTIWVFHETTKGVPSSMQGQEDIQVHQGNQKLRLMYPRESPLDLVAIRTTIVATSTTKLSITAAASMVKYYGSAKSIIGPMTKHIEIRHHFIRDCYEKKLIQVQKIHTDLNVADLLTKAFDGPRYYLEFESNVARPQLGQEKGLQLSLAKLDADWLIVDSSDLKIEFWPDCNCKTLADGTQQLNATIDSIEYTITEESDIKATPISRCDQGLTSDRKKVKKLENKLRQKEKKRGNEMKGCEGSQAPLVAKIYQKETKSTSTSYKVIDIEEPLLKETQQIHLDELQAKIVEQRLNADQILSKKIQQEEREQYSIEDRAKFLHDTIAAQRKFLTEQRYAAIRNKPPTISQLRNQMITYLLKHAAQ